MFRPQPISSTDARKYFTKIINKVSFSSKSFVIRSYRQPLVRIVNENYIRALEEVIGKKTVNQIMQVASNDRLFEAEKIEQIKKVFQRRLSGAQRPERSPRAEPRGRSRGAQSPQPQAQKPSPPQPKPQPQAQKKLNLPQQKKVPERGSETQKKPQNRQQGGGVILLPSGKNRGRNYE